MDNLKEQFLGFYNTPVLFDELYSLKQFCFDEINTSNLQIEDIKIDTKLPLGKRVEYFFEHYLNLTTRYKLIKKNIQIIKDKNTLGELDFIVFDKKENCFKHIELIYKYYLYDVRLEKELDRYIGPNKNDTLVRKLTKLRDKQLPLLFKDVTREYLSEIDFSNIKQEVCYKANIFLPFYHKALQIKFQDSIKGYYLGFNDFENDDIFKKCSFYIPHRYDWVNFEKYNQEYISYEKALEQIKFFHKYNKSPLVWVNNNKTIYLLFITFWH
ncbi:hypothetical protein CRV01_06975 [Arcobacter sp. CECT 8983]|uniref:DUF1853 family protein n=1 Tax=Arcobacter sp. CECT 8983 TaxID=2044508 RepID=UPI00100A3037|nr:DUF1853 family protein [Arcobacter sp. CECT 8983]RXJ90881.1 hypothetical protein CRV01_06975 [Arcobacter sp. CECT 8983]